jgi:cephalosporin hydroxylase
MAAHLKRMRELCNIIYGKRGPAKTGMWRGVRALKYPTDLMLYGEMIFDNKPDFIIETGMRYGGSVLFYADMCRLANKGKVISIENDEQWESPKHTRLDVIYGDSVAEDVIKQVADKVEGKSVMIILDSSHHPDHVYKELCAYTSMLQIGDYIIVEDLDALEAHVSVVKFLDKHQNFRRDKSAEKYGIHCAAGGFIKRVS